jgi:hypothetical protein
MFHHHKTPFLSVVAGFLLAISVSLTYAKLPESGTLAAFAVAFAGMVTTRRRRIA